MATMEGIITLVQESRFLLRQDGGAAHLFILDPHASAEPSDLEPLVARQSRIRVDYRSGETILGSIARDVFVLGAPGARS